MHVLVRIQPRYTFDEVRRAALALSRAVERRLPALATSKWWKEERHGVFIDYNQNAKDRTTCSAYSVRPTPDARISAPLRWDEVSSCEPADFTLATMPARFRELGDLHGGIDASAGALDALLELGSDRRSLGARRRALATAFSQARLGIDTGRPLARQELGGAQGSSHPHAARHGGQLAGQGGSPGRPRALETAASRGRGTTRDRRRTGGFDARQVVDLDAHSHQPAQRPGTAATPPEPPDPDDDPTRGWRKSKAQ